MDTPTYICEYCFTEYRPTRRRVQRYCSASCRSNAYHHRKKQQILKETIEVVQNVKNSEHHLKKNEEKKEKTSVDKMSLAGVGNSMAGTLLSEAAISLFTKQDNKPATKGDIKALENSLKRYQRIRNLKPDSEGRLAYYDMRKMELIYLQMSPFATNRKG